jgi:hypothetical protein
MVAALVVAIVAVVVAVTDTVGEATLVLVVVVFAVAVTSVPSVVTVSVTVATGVLISAKVLVKGVSMHEHRVHREVSCWSFWLEIEVALDLRLEAEVVFRLTVEADGRQARGRGSRWRNVRAEMVADLHGLRVDSLRLSFVNAGGRENTDCISCSSHSCCHSEGVDLSDSVNLNRRSGWACSRCRDFNHGNGLGVVRCNSDKCGHRGSEHVRDGYGSRRAYRPGVLGTAITLCCRKSDELIDHADILAQGAGI